MSIDRRRFLTVSAASLSGALVAACSKDPASAHKLLALAQRGNERLERALFRHASMNRVPSSAPLAGNDFPRYFISERVPVWDAATRGTWRLEVSGAVRRPLSLTPREAGIQAHEVPHAHRGHAGAEWRLLERSRLRVVGRDLTQPRLPPAISGGTRHAGCAV